MSELPKAGALLFAKDLERMASFYEQVAGLTVKARVEGRVVLESAHYSLVLHALPQIVADNLTITSPPMRRTDVPVKLIFPVASLALVHTLSPMLGGGVDSESAEWIGPGFRACEGFDPEGNLVQWREPLA
jgi:hypothetical protein